ncbi:MAG: hypothetical protein ACLQVI_14275 [Polyangiaceae bacterium]
MRRISFAVVSLAASVVACGSSSNGNNGGGGAQDSGAPGNQTPDGASTQPVNEDATAPIVDSGGGTNDSGGGVDSSLPPFDGGSVSTQYPAPHPAWPTEVYQGSGGQPGPSGLLLTPDVLTITFNSDTLATSLNSFGAQATVSTNAYWQTVRAGYCETPSTTACVGNGTAGTSKALTETLAASYTDSAQGGASTLQTFIQGLIAADKITVGTNTLPVFYFPQTVSITLDGAPSCANGGFGGYHNSMTTTAGGSTTIPYAIVMECVSPAGQTPTTLQETTIAASHEIVEAATDPYNFTGYYLNLTENDPAPLAWNDVGFGEVGDNCVDFLGLNQDEYTEDGFTVQRIWNNAAAAAGGDPCVPARPATQPYFNVAVEQWLVTEAVGATTVFDADAFSNMAVSGGWNVVGYDLNAQSATDLNPYLTIAINGVTQTAGSVTINNGQKAQIAVTLNQDPGALVASAFGAVGLLLSYQGTSLQTMTAGAVWPFIVQSPADATDSGLVGYDAAEDMPRHPQPKRVSITREQMERARRILSQIGR